MWRAYNQDGTLTYTFAGAVLASYPGYVVRMIGGTIFFLGMLVMAYNVYMTTRSNFEPETAPAASAGINSATRRRANVSISTRPLLANQRLWRL